MACMRTAAQLQIQRLGECQDRIDHESYIISIDSVIEAQVELVHGSGLKGEGQAQEATVTRGTLQPRPVPPESVRWIMDGQKPTDHRQRGAGGCGGALRGPALRVVVRTWAAPAVQHSCMHCFPCHWAERECGWSQGGVA